MTPGAISLDGTATREMANDVLAIYFRVNKDGKDANVVQNELREAVTAALEVVRPSLKENEVDVQTEGFNVSPRYAQATAGKAAKLDGYIGVATIVVKGTDTATISKLASQIKTMVVSGTTNSLSRKAKQAAEGELTDLAIKNFQSKADAAAAAFGAKDWTLGEIRITVQGDGGGIRGKAFTLSASAGGGMESASMQIESGKSEMTAYVQGEIVLGKTKRVLVK